MEAGCAKVGSAGVSFIIEFDVHTAADEIVGTGERPTVERIRAHLGTGSPNTVTRWLDSWWRLLGTRLTAQQVRAAFLAEARLVLDAERIEVENAQQANREAEAAAATAIEAAYTKPRRWPKPGWPSPNA
ncbi:MAG: DNA-binding protein [Pseudoxanthomonas sp.]